MINIHNLTKKFVKDKVKKEEFLANNQITFVANDGEIIGILRTKWSRKNNIIENDGRNIRAHRRNDRI